LIHSICDTPASLHLDARDLVLQLRLLTFSGALADREQPALSGHQSGDVRIAFARVEIFRKRDGFEIVAFGFLAGLAGGEFVELLGDDGEVSAGLGVVEPHQHLPVRTRTVLDQHLADHAAGRMLDLLDVAVDHQDALGDQGTRQVGGERPTADQRHQQRGRPRCCRGARTSKGIGRRVHPGTPS
jgi:hypothetical protein